MPFHTDNNVFSPDRSAKFSSLAQSCQDFLFSDPEELVRFMKTTGFGPDSLRTALGTPELELAVFNYFANNEPALLAMCANKNINITHFMQIWNQLNAQF